MSEVLSVEEAKTVVRAAATPSPVWPDVAVSSTATLLIGLWAWRSAIDAEFQKSWIPVVVLFCLACRAVHNALRARQAEIVANDMAGVVGRLLGCSRVFDPTRGSSWASRIQRAPKDKQPYFDREAGQR